MENQRLSLIVSVYNEEKGLEQFYTTVRDVLEKAGITDHQILFVNDGSTDGSGALLESIRGRDPQHVAVVSFSRNFGHEAAMTAGLDYADGDCLVFMDADLQHPPALIPEIMERFAEGYEVINMVRTRNKSAGLIKNLTSALFYQVINKISDVHMEPGASDFFALDKKAAEVLRHSYREKVRFLRGYVQNIGFRHTVIKYEAAERAAGRSHYNLIKLLRLSIDTIVCFSNLPLKLGVYAGLGTGLMGVLLIIYTLFTRQGAPSGYATIVIVLCFMFAVLFLLLGIIGEYLAIMFREIKDRPVYIIENIYDETKLLTKSSNHDTIGN